MMPSFLNVFSQFLCLVSPTIVPFKEDWIGNQSSQSAVDKYGNSVAAQPGLTGGSFICAHNTIKNVFQNVLEAGGMETQRDAANIFHGKVPSLYLDWYLKNISQFSA